MFENFHKRGEVGLEQEEASQHQAIGADQSFLIHFDQTPLDLTQTVQRMIAVERAAPVVQRLHALDPKHLYYPDITLRRGLGNG